MTTTIGPALGHGPWTQQGVGTTPGYDAIDLRRQFEGVADEGIISSGSYAVSQRAAGANVSVDIAASTGSGARVQGDAVTLQGLYTIAPHASVINETITAAHATLPRNDLVVLEIKDHQHDASGSNLAQTRVITGTATAGAAATDALGVNGTPTLPTSAIALAVVNVPAADTSITDSQIDDRRTPLWRGGAGGKSIIATEETRNNAAYGLLTTPDRVRNVVLPTDGLIFVAYQARWKETTNPGVSKAAIFIGANHLKTAVNEPSLPTIQEADFSGGGAGAGLGKYRPLASGSVGLSSIMLSTGPDYGGDVTTGQLVAASDYDGSQQQRGGPCAIFAAAGTYDVSVQFLGQSVSVRDRKLWVWTMGF